jgi:hypothetical protein
MSKLAVGFVILAFFLALPSMIPKHNGIMLGASAEAQSGYRIGATVMGSTGSSGSSPPYTLNVTMGQPTPVGTGFSTGKTLLAGFWSRYWIPTNVEETSVVLRNDLFQNFPNPFNPLTTIEYSVSKAGPVRVAVFSVDGQRVRTLVNENKSPGKYKIIWNGRNEKGTTVSSGIYFYRLEIGSYSSVKKMILLR